MKIIQLIPRLPRAAERDFFAAVSRELERSGDTVRILSLLPGPATPPGVPFSALPERLLPWPGAGRSPELLTDLREYCRDADLLHLHGTLLYPVRYAAAIRRESACKVAWSPEGNCGFLLRLCGTLRRAAADFLLVRTPEEERVFAGIPLRRAPAEVPEWPSFYHRLIEEHHG